MLFQGHFSNLILGGFQQFLHLFNPQNQRISVKLKKIGAFFSYQRSREIRRKKGIFWEKCRQWGPGIWMPLKVLTMPRSKRPRVAEKISPWVWKMVWRGASHYGRKGGVLYQNGNFLWEVYNTWSLGIMNSVGQVVFVFEFFTVQPRKTQLCGTKGGWTQGRETLPFARQAERWRLPWKGNAPGSFWTGLVGDRSRCHDLRIFETYQFFNYWGNPWIKPTYVKKIIKKDPYIHIDDMFLGNIVR